MQKQEKTQWCWNASGNTIAAYWGYNYTQTEFCNLAHAATGVSCANQPATLGDMAGAWGCTAGPVLADALRIAYVVSPVSPDSGSGRSATVLLAATQGGGWHLAGVRESDWSTTRRASPAASGPPPRPTDPRPRPR
ncbi:hypothetical protein FGW37_20430 [Streptomyces rectiverticillatus]|uniref:papain-like cysteine protease family protein n=1 Tax=Streptomyces rectiverticillatus TaxID=173860 RepID=UPI0015C2D14D|nr:papain-like cysteine protease family protein [Streptomyces rectiverticillatus]QLE73634.1 hypothetical protein FGW37_20430 [Streptomyces rectiverticillatus]